jgi:O-antigen biosynthesis protein
VLINLKPELSVIIINYNVAYFLEQCLNSCLKAAEHAHVEIIVIDNNSVDGSDDMMRDKFPKIPYIFNKENLGFSKANNQGMKMAQGQYILLLNPDTVVEEMTFRLTIDFMNEHPDAGGLGVRMLDGRGKFLPESKRGLPTPAVAFYKIFGLSTLFPKSRIFGKYHLGYLDEFETHDIEILSGAFMMMRKSVLDEIGLLDEAFFMYGEDIDLSYRIVQAGYKNYYFPHTRIIHYKGESTKKSSVNYVFVFYRAMIIFANKHFSQNNAKLFSFLINSAVYFRAGLAISRRLISKSALGVLDFSAILLLLFVLSNFFKENDKVFPAEILKFALPSYTLIWLSSLFFSGVYDRPISWMRLLRGGFIGTIAILALYALLPKELQFSRLFILIGALLVASYFVLSRIALHYLIPKGKFLNVKTDKIKVIVGSLEECTRVAQVLKSMELTSSKMKFVSAGTEKYADAIGVIAQLNEIVEIHKVDEVIFCAKDTSAQEIISWMSSISKDNLAFKIAQPESSFIIGSNSIDHPGELYLMNINAISEPRHKRAKRTFDILVALFFILLFPLGFLFMSRVKRSFSDLFQILLGKLTWVGYAGQSNNSKVLPNIKKGVFSAAYQFDNSENLSKVELQKINLIYAKDYKWQFDLQIVFRLLFSKHANTYN